jgi:hypothetical protein
MAWLEVMGMGRAVGRSTGRAAHRIGGGDVLEGRGIRR